MGCTGATPSSLPLPLTSTRQGAGARSKTTAGARCCSVTARRLRSASDRETEDDSGAGCRGDDTPTHARLPRFPTVTVPPAHTNVSGRVETAASRHRCGTRPPQERLWRQPTRAAVRLVPSGQRSARGVLAEWLGSARLRIAYRYKFHIDPRRLNWAQFQSRGGCSGPTGAGPGRTECDRGAGPTEPSTARQPVGRAESHRSSCFQGWGGTRLAMHRFLHWEGADDRGRLSQAASGLALHGWSWLDSAGSLRAGAPEECHRACEPRGIAADTQEHPRLNPPSESASSTACFHRVVHSLSTYMHVESRPKSQFFNFSTPHRIGVKMTNSQGGTFRPDSDHQTRTQ